MVMGRSFREKVVCVVAAIYHIGMARLFALFHLVSLCVPAFLLPAFPGPVGSGFFFRDFSVPGVHWNVY